ncbi:MAG: oligosaccharide flippase family protein [Pseudomonadota bacterium]
MREHLSLPHYVTRIRQIGWNSTNVLIGTHTGRAFLQLISNQLLSRILYPEAFAIIMLVGSVQFSLALASDLGVKPYVIRQQGSESPQKLDAVWTFEVIRGIILATCVFATAGPLASLFQEPLLKGPLQFLGVIFLLQSFRSLGAAMATRELQDWRNSLIGLGTYTAQMVGTILLALMLKSHWALVYGLAIGAVFEVVASYVFYHKPWRRFRFDPDVLKELWGFSKFIFATSLLTIVVTQVDKFFVIREMPMVLAGCYAIAIRFMLIGNKLIKTYYMRIYYAASSLRLRNNATDSDAYYKPLARMRPLFGFLCAAGIMVAEPFIEILLDDRYLPAGVFAAILFIRPLIGAVVFPAEQFLIAKSLAKVKFAGEILRGIWMLAAMPFAYAYFGVIGLVWAVAFHHVGPLLLYYIVLLRMGAVEWSREVSYGAAVVVGFLTGGFVAYLYGFVQHFFVGTIV